MNPIRLLAALVCLVAWTLAPTTRADGAKPFHQRVDLEPLGRIAVHAEGRLKSFGSHANTMLHFVSGPREINGQDAAFTYIDMMLRPEAYADADIIYIKNKQVREAIAKALLERDPGLAERMRVFQETGLTSPTLLRRPELGPLYRALEADLVRTAKPMDQLKSALAVADARFLLSRLRIVPPGTGEFEHQWHGIDEIMLVPGQVAAPAALRALLPGAPTAPIPNIDPQLQAEIADGWRSFVAAWMAQDVDGVARAATALGESLPKVSPTIYPEQSRLAWEQWYFTMDQLTSIWLVYLLATVFLLLGVVYRWPTASRIGVGVFTVAFALQTFALLLRWYISARWPNSNMFEAVTTAAWFGGCGAFVIEYFTRRSPMRGFFFLGSAVASMVALMTAHFLPVYLNPNISNMMPVLHDVWLYIHTNVIIFAYCLIFMAAVSAFLYIAWRAVGNGPAYARVGGAGTLVLAGAPGNPALAARRTSLGEVLDGVTMVLMELSFVLLWAGIVMGAIWADHSWGRPWGWDPKEVFALNTFVIFALLVHVRLKVADKGLWTAILAVIGAAVMLFNWIVINFVITGLHSYA